MKNPALLLIPVVVAATGCVMPDQMASLQKSVADVQQQIAAVNKSQADVSKKVADLDAKLGSGDTVKREEIADVKATLDGIIRQSTANADKIEQVNARVDRLSQDVELIRESGRRAGALVQPQPSPAPPSGDPGAPGSAVPAAPAPGSSIPNPNALYTSAYADFSKGNYPLAIQGFEEYASRFPDAELADNAMYWIGECRFSQGNFKGAIDAFDAMLAKYPKSDKAAAANLKKALAFLQLNQVGQGVEQLRYVVGTYPGTDEARIAKDRLTALGKP